MKTFVVPVFYHVRAETPWEAALALSGYLSDIEHDQDPDEPGFVEGCFVTFAEDETEEVAP